MTDNRLRNVFIAQGSFLTDKALISFTIGAFQSVTLPKLYADTCDASLQSSESIFM